MKHSITTPIIHLNGTPKQMLLDQLNNAYRKIDEAIYALRRAAPNGRDYYPEPGRMDWAVEQHDRRMRALCDLLSEIECEIQMIDDCG